MEVQVQFVDEDHPRGEGQDVSIEMRVQGGGFACQIAHQGQHAPLTVAEVVERVPLAFAEVHHDLSDLGVEEDVFGVQDVAYQNSSDRLVGCGLLALLEGQPSLSGYPGHHFRHG